MRLALYAAGVAVLGGGGSVLDLDPAMSLVLRFVEGRFGTEVEFVGWGGVSFDCGVFSSVFWERGGERIACTSREFTFEDGSVEINEER